MPDFFCNSFETPLLPGSSLKFWDLGALGNCLTRLREGPALVIVESQQRLAFYFKCVITV